MISQLEIDSAESTGESKGDVSSSVFVCAEFLLANLPTRRCTLLDVLRLTSLLSIFMIPTLGGSCLSLDS